MTRSYGGIMPFWHSRHIRATAVLFAGVAATVWFAQFLDKTYPLKDWLFFSLAKIWAWDAFLSLAFVSTGYLLLTRVFMVRGPSGLEQLCLSAGIGAVVFVMGMYAGGFLALYGRVFAVALPLSMVLAGARSGWPALRTALIMRRSSLSPLSLLAIAFGTLSLGVLYLGLLSPEAVNYDAGWNHLVISQDYARAGRIVPFLADWVKNVPHLGSIVNTWAFLTPGLGIPALRWMMALHDEFTFFLWTLVGVAAVVRWLTERNDLRGTWAAFFLFPGIFVHDGNMGAAADHFLAFFIPPLFLAAVRALDRLQIRACALTGMLAAGALLTKLHAVYVLGPLAFAFAVRFAFLTVRRMRGSMDAPSVKAGLAGLATLAASGIVFASPHFLKNWVFYKNPLYPLAQAQFPASTPGIPDAATQMAYLFADWRYHVPSELGPRLKAAARLVFTYSFEPHYSFMGAYPTSGSLFTLSLLFLPFLPHSRRLWFGAFVGSGALFCWAFTFWVDRNLQTFMPLLVAVACGVFVRGWELGWMSRIGITALVGLQLVWGVDLYFSGSDRIASSIALIRSGFDGRAKKRLESFRSDYLELGKSLPKDAVILLHDQHVMLGIDRPVYQDMIGFQGLIDYRSFKTARDFYDRLRQVGVTHIVHATSNGPTISKQEEIVFHELVSFYGKKPRQFGELLLLPVPATPPPKRPPLKVLSVGMSGYKDGVYPIEALSVCEQMPPDMQHFPEPARKVTDSLSPAELLPVVDAVLLGSSAPLTMADDMKRIIHYPGFAVYARAERGATP